MKSFNLLTEKYFTDYIEQQSVDLKKLFSKIKSLSQRDDLLHSSFMVSAIASSNIEGNPVDLDSYMQYKLSGMEYQNKSIFEIECLINAYEFAKRETLSLENLLEAHQLYAISLNIQKGNIGAFRRDEVGVYQIKIGEMPTKIYSAASKEIVQSEMKKLFDDVTILNKRVLSIDEAFYFASFLHLIFVKIHPFADGNGRAGRLLEKWFLAHHLGPTAWHIRSELYYWKNLRSYYSRLRIGKTYETIDYDKSLPFLLMLPKALTLK
jgi:Fic family protein